MAEAQHLPILVCHGCQERIALPRQSQVDIVLGQSYLPTDDQPLVFVCPHCEHQYAYWKSDVLVESVPTLGQESRPIDRVFLRVELRCDHENCGLPIVLHTTAGKGIARAAIELRVSKAIPTPKCENGHTLRANPLIENLKVID